MKRIFFWGGGIVVVFLILAAVFGNKGADTEPANPAPGPSPVSSVDPWQAVRAGDPAHVPAGWKPAVRLAVNGDQWEDGPFITADGSQLYFQIWPGEDLLADIQNGKLIGKNIKEYVSAKPFITRTLADIPGFDPNGPFSTGGVMISGHDIYYNYNGYEGKGEYQSDIYKNGQRLPFNDKSSETDAHYCAAKDELYFWKSPTDVNTPGQGDIYVYKKGTLSKLPAPINSSADDMQPFLTPDCQTMYFTSLREGAPIIYVSKRTGEDSWGPIEKFLWSKGGITEFTMTADEKTATFLQLFMNAKGGRTTDVYLMERQ